MATTQALGQKISDPAQLKNYREDQIIRVGSDIYLKPTQQAAAAPSQPASNPFSSTNSDVQAQIAKMQSQVQALSSKAGQTPTSSSPAMSSPTPPKTTVPQSTYTPPAQTQSQTQSQPTPPPQTSAAKIDLSKYGGTKSATGAFTNVDFNRINSDYENVSAVGNPDQGGYYTGTAIPKATLISPTGQRVVVRTDGKSSPGLPSADEYFKQGFVLEKTPGVYDSGSGQKQTFGTTQLTPQAPKPPSAPTAASTGAGSAGLPPGYVRIPSTYSTTAAQKSAFDDIKVSGNIGEPGSFLYGKPKEGTQTGGGDSGLGGLTGATGVTQLPPAFSSNDPTLQSILRNFIGQSAVGSKDAANAAGTSEDEFNKKAEQYFLERDKQLKALEEAYYKDAMPSEEENAAQKAIDEIIAQQSNINSSKELGINEIKKQPIAMGFLAGQSSAVERDAATKIGALSSQSEPLKAKLAALQAKRTAALNVDKDRIASAREDLKNLNEQMKPMEVGGNVLRYNPITKNYDVVYKGASKETAPVSVSQGSALVDPTTGRVIYQGSGSGQDMQIVTDPITGKIYRVDKNGEPGLVFDGTSSSVLLGTDFIGQLATQALSNPAIFEAIPEAQKKAVIERIVSSGNNLPANVKPANDTQVKDAGYASRIKEAESIFKELESKVSALDFGTFYAYKVLPNPAKPAWFQQQEQAQRNFVNAVLRRESGAVISPSEFENAAQQYFPQPGDSQEVLAQKARNRAIQMNNFIQSAGPAWEQASNSLDSMGGQQDIQSVSQKYGISPQEIQDTLNKPNMTMQKIIDYLELKKGQAPNPSAGGTGAVTPGNTTRTNDLNKVMRAISTFESGNKYNSIGKKTKSGDYAYGKYQIMGNNIPSWSKAALGYSVTPQQFLASPDIQEKVATYKIGEYLKKYGNLEDVASVWFSGKPAANNFAKDANGTTVPHYIASVRSIYQNS